MMLTTIGADIVAALGEFAAACAACGAVDGQSLDQWAIWAGVLGATPLAALVLGEARERAIFDPEPPITDARAHEMWDRRREWETYVRNQSPNTWIEYGPGEIIIYSNTDKGPVMVGDLSDPAFHGDDVPKVPK